MGWYEDALKAIEKLPPEHKERRELCKEDLWVFAQTMNPTYLYGDIHRKIYKWMQEYSLFGLGDELTSNKLVMLPRAHLKSHMVATWAAWIITRHPEITILYVSATSNLAEKQLFDIQNLMESGPYQHFFPEYIHPQKGKRTTWNTNAMIIDHPARAREGVRDPTIATAGLTTNTTGWHASIICADDLVVPENAYTEKGRADVAAKVAQFSSIRNPGGFTLAAGTRYHPNDIYATWKEQEYEVYNDEGDLIDKRLTWDIQEFVVEKDGTFLWPRTIGPGGKAEGFNRNVLSRIRSDYVNEIVQFYAQYYNDPNSAGTNRINRDRFQYIDEKLVKYSNGSWYVRGKRVNVYAAIDFAYTTRKTSDYTAIVVVGMDCDGFYYVLDIDRFKTDKIQVMYDHIMDIHDKWRLRKLRAEVTGAQSIIAGDLKDRIREEGGVLVIDEYRPSTREGSKEERIAAVLEPRYENMSIYHIQGGLTGRLEEELILARPKHDDMKDALASAISICKKPARERSEMKSSNVSYGKFGGVKFRRDL